MNIINSVITMKGDKAVKNKGKRIKFALVLLGVLLVLAGCTQGDLVIVGVEPGQPGPTSGQLRITFKAMMSKDYGPSKKITINDLSLTEDTTFTITNEDTGDKIKVTNPTLDPDPAITYVRF